MNLYYFTYGWDSSNKFIFFQLEQNTGFSCIVQTKDNNSHLNFRSDVNPVVLKKGEKSC